MRASAALAAALLATTVVLSACSDEFPACLRGPTASDPTIDALPPASDLQPAGRFIVELLPGHEPSDAVQAAGGRVVRPMRARNAVVATLDPVQARALERLPGVARVERDAPRFPFSQQQLPPGIAQIRSPEIWEAGRGGVKTCVIDSGLYTGHEDLKEPSVGGYPAGWDVDRCGHGTHVAGTIAALDNGVGVVGVNPAGVDLFMVKVFNDACGWGYASDIIDALDRCRLAGAKVVNLSLGGDGPSLAEAEAFERAFRSGMLLVAAAGNDGGATLQYPASYPSVISVGAVDADGKVAGFSQHNGRVDLVAPGVEILSTVPYASEEQVTVGGKRFEGHALEHAAETAGISGALVDGGACDKAQSFAGRIVLCRRGGSSFSDKVAVVAAGYGAAAVIYNDEPGSFAGTLGSSPSAIPALSVSDADGRELLQHLGQSATAVSRVVTPASGYSYYTGTSMAAPHVTGVAALVWAHDPTWTNAQVRAALEAGAKDLGDPGRDEHAGAGLVQADRTLALLQSRALGDAPPKAGFLTSCRGLTCTFHSTSLDPDGALVSQRFDLGDGTFADGVEVTHTYASAGARTVTLEVEDGEGARDRLSIPVSAVSVTAAQEGPRQADGFHIALHFDGAAGDTVVVMKDGRALGSVPNDGAFVDVMKDVPVQPVAYAVCSADGESCSAPVYVPPKC